MGSDLLETRPPPRDLLLDKGLNGKAFAAGQADRGTAVLIPPAKGQRHRMPSILQKIIAELRSWIETTFKDHRPDRASTTSSRIGLAVGTLIGNDGPSSYGTWPTCGGS